MSTTFNEMVSGPAVSEGTSRGPLHGPAREWRAPQTGGSPWVLVLVCAAQFMVVLDVSIVNVALPSIQRDLGFGQLTLQWVISAYALVFSGLLLLGGRLADLYGRKPVFLCGLTLFTASSLVGGIAWTGAILIAARAVQGLGAAVLAPATLAILTTTFGEGATRTRALAAWTAVGLAGGTAGNLFGGALTQYPSWRSIFLINIPIGVLAIILATRLLAREQPRGRSDLDILGAVLVTGAVGSLVYAITQTHTRGWTSPVTLGGLTVAIAGMAAFVGVERRLARDPLIPLGLFRVRAISLGNLVMLLAGACLMPMWYFLSLFMQKVLHYGSLHTGLGFLPHTLVTMCVGWWVSPRLMRRVTDRVLILAGALIAAGGFLWQSQITAASGYLSGVLGPGIVISLGGGLLIAPLTTTVTSGISKADAGAASGLMNTAKQVGGVLGLAALVTLAASPVHTRQALAADYDRAFLTIAVILVIVAAAALGLPPRRDPSIAPRAERDRQPGSG